MARLLRHPQTKGRETDRPSLNHRDTSRLYPHVKHSFGGCALAAVPGQAVESDGAEATPV